MDKEDVVPSAEAFHSWRVGSCVYRCRICTCDFANSLQFWRHVKDHHRMASPAAYLAAFPGDPAPCVLRRGFACGVCGADVAHDLGKMTMHMLKKHAGMDLREYYDKFVAAAADEEKALVSKTDNEGTKAQPEADSHATSELAGRSNVVPEGFSIVAEDAFHGFKDRESADSDDGKPLNRLRRGRKKKRKRKQSMKMSENRVEEDSDSEPIISDEEERNFTYQSQPKRACVKRITPNQRSLDKIDNPSEENVVHDTQEESSLDTIFGSVGELANAPKGSPINRPQLEDTFHGFKDGESTDSDDEKPLIRVRRVKGRKKKRLRKQRLKRPENKKQASEQNTPKTPKTPKTILKKESQAVLPSKAGLHWAIGCAFRCLTCGTVVWGRLNMRNHLLAAHKKRWNGKTERYEKVYNSMFTCKICNEEFSHELDRVHQHMKGKHDISAKIYHEKYLTGKVKKISSEKSQMKSQQSLENECPICKKAYKRSGGNGLARHMREVHGETVKENEDSGNDSMSEGNTSVEKDGNGNESALGTSSVKCEAGNISVKPKSKMVKQVLAATPKLDQKSEWYDGCVFACTVCSASSPSRETVRSHCAKVHHDASKVTAVSTASYKCKICLADVLHEKEALKEHFLTEHNTRLASYFNAYEDAQREARSREKEERRRLSKEKQGCNSIDNLGEPQKTHPHHFGIFETCLNLLSQY